VLLWGFWVVVDMVLFSMSSRFRLINLGGNFIRTSAVDVGIGISIFMGRLDSLVTEVGFVIGIPECRNPSIRRALRFMYVFILE